MKVIERDNTHRSRNRPRTCEANGCEQSTREGKPYCSEHVDMNDYAAKVIAALERRDAEDELIVKRGASSGFTHDSVTAQEILHYLSDYGPRTKERICRDLILDRAIVDAYAKVLVRKKILSQGRTRRGSETLALVGNP